MISPSKVRTPADTLYQEGSANMFGSKALAMAAVTLLLPSG